MNRSLALVLALTGCARTTPTDAPSAQADVALDDASPAALRWERRVLADGLANPRGLLRLDATTLLVGEAGVGDPALRNTGRLLRLTDGDGDGRLEARTPVLDAQPSINIVERLEVHRDEVFGFADIARGDDMILASVADPTEGSVIWRVDGTPARWGTTAGNANSMAWHPTRERWYAVQSFANTVIDLQSGEVVAELPPLPDGQQAVPAALIHEPERDALLVALFSGQVGGDTQGTGVDFVVGSGRVVRLDPADGALQTVVDGLNAPTDLALADDGRLLVLEFCDAFVDPVADLDAARGSDGHGGFSRYSGRLLAIDLATGEREQIAEGLDLPTHVLVDGPRILVTEGQGTPGRPIPSPQGPTKIDGRVVELHRTQ